MLPDNCFKGLEKMQNRAVADEKKSLEEKPADDKFKRVGCCKKYASYSVYSVGLPL